MRPNGWLCYILFFRSDILELITKNCITYNPFRLRLVKVELPDYRVHFILCDSGYTK